MLSEAPSPWSPHPSNLIPWKGMMSFLLRAKFGGLNTKPGCQLPPAAHATPPFSANSRLLHPASPALTHCTHCLGTHWESRAAVHSVCKASLQTGMTCSLLHTRASWESCSSADRLRSSTLDWSGESRRCWGPGHTRSVYARTGVSAF